MAFEELLSKCLPILKQHSLVLLFAGIGLICFGYGLIASFAPEKQQPMVFQDTLQPSPETKAPTKTIMVDIEGAVVKPGVYSVVSTARVGDGLLAAGGLSQEADTQWIAHNINLAAKLTDGQKIYVSFKGENDVSMLQSTGETGSSLVSINTGTGDALDTLPGVGAVTAQKIITARPYNDLNELISKKVVSTKVFDEIKDKISL